MTRRYSITLEDDMTGDNLRAYECPEEWLNACNADCSYRGKCVVLPVFRALADVVAKL